MPEHTDDTGNVETPQDAAETTPEGNDEAQTDETTSEQPDDYAELKGALARERDAAKALKKDLRDAVKRLSDLENAGKPELERVTEERDALAKELASVTGMVRESTAKELVFNQAQKAGAPKPGTIWRIVKHDLEYDDDGAVTNLDAVLRDLKTESPEMFRAVGPADSASGAGSPARGGDWLRNAMQAKRG